MVFRHFESGLIKGRYFSCEKSTQKTGILFRMKVNTSTNVD